MADLKVIADALATQYGTISATFGSTTETVTATASLPDTIDLALLVYPPSGLLQLELGPNRNDLWDFPVRLLRDPISMPARTDALYAWLNALRDVAEAKKRLGLAYVVNVESVSARLEFEGQGYSFPDGKFKQFDVVEIVNQVRVQELVTTVHL